MNYSSTISLYFSNHCILEIMLGSQNKVFQQVLFPQLIFLTKEHNLTLDYMLTQIKIANLHVLGEKLK